MKISKKRGSDKIKITHNKKLFWTIILLMVILIALMVIIVKNKEKDNAGTEKGECEKDADCVPGGCCHPSNCVPKEQAPDCGTSICTLDCSGPLDCGAGSCGCVKEKCSIIPGNE